jgi:hypothetical protein
MTPLLLNRDETGHALIGSLSLRRAAHVDVSI